MLTFFGSFFFQAEDGIRDGHVTGVQTCALPIYLSGVSGFSFLTRGDGKAYRVILFTPSNGFQPLIQTLESGDEWERVTFSGRDFQLDGTNIAGSAGGGGPDRGPFQLPIGDHRLSCVVQMARGQVRRL